MNNLMLEELKELTSIWLEGTSTAKQDKRMNYLSSLYMDEIEQEESNSYKLIANSYFIEY